MNFLNNFYYKFIVFEENHLNEIQNLHTKLIDNNKIEVLPIIQNNMQFIKKYSFFNTTDIKSQHQTIDEIKIKSVFNPLLFGKIYILPNGDVFANLNYDKLGNINFDTFGKLVHDNFLQPNAWMKCRKFVKPCKSCKFNEMCPPISNYEIYSKKFNFCKILIN